MYAARRMVRRGRGWMSRCKVAPGEARVSEVPSGLGAVRRSITRINACDGCCEAGHDPHIGAQLHRRWQRSLDAHAPLAGPTGEKQSTSSTPKIRFKRTNRRRRWPRRGGGTRHLSQHYSHANQGHARHPSCSLPPRSPPLQGPTVDDDDAFVSGRDDVAKLPAGA